MRQEADSSCIHESAPGGEGRTCKGAMAGGRSPRISKALLRHRHDVSPPRVSNSRDSRQSGNLSWCNGPLFSPGKEELTQSRDRGIFLAFGQNLGGAVSW